MGETHARGTFFFSTFTGAVVDVCVKKDNHCTTAPHLPPT